MPSSPYADEGTAAHLLAAVCFETATDPADHIGETFQVGARSFPVDDGMAEAVAIFTQYARNLVNAGYHLQFEVRLDLSHLHPGQFGTGDAILFHPEHHHLVVGDFKFGAGVIVNPTDNPQLLAYASGAARRYKSTRSLTLTIVQPRTPGEPILEWETTPARLAEFEAEFRLAAARTDNPNAPLIPGDWCRFCPASAICPALKGRAMAIARAEFADIAQTPYREDAAMSELAAQAQELGLYGDNNAGQRDMNAGQGRIVSLPDPTSFSSEELGDILANADLLEHWLAEVRGFALQQALAGKLPAGYKVVRKITHRKWTDADAARQILQLVYDDVPSDDFLTIPTLKSPAQIEKLLARRSRPTACWPSS